LFTPNAYTPANDSHARHIGRQSGAPANSTSVYSFQCGVCHYNNNHQNDNVDIVFSLPAPMPQPSPNGFVATVPPGGSHCTNIYCHSAGHDNLAVQDYRDNTTWGTTSLGCNGCHGTTTFSGNANYGMPDYTNGGVGTPTANSHAKHVAEKGYACNVCHAGTVTDNGAILGTVPTLHVNGVRNVAFGGIATGVGATPYDNATKTCSVSCHGNAGSATLPRWGGTPMAGCGVCHQHQGASTGTSSSNGAHHAHTTYTRFRVACETCHAARAGAHVNTAHAGGPDNAAAGKTAEVKYTDNAANQTYDNVAAVYLSKDLWNNPFTGLPVAPGPGYANASAPGGSDAFNSTISWTPGTCGNVWCHSNANPLGGANAYRTPQWTDSCGYCHKPRASDLDCTQCHAIKAAAAQMAAADNLSRVHVRHAATDRYNFSCDECHAWTVPDNYHGSGGLGILSGAGHDNHVDGIKTVRFSTTLRSTNINQSGGTYDNAVGNYRCYNTYCHSNGTDNTTFNTTSQWPVDNTVGWDNTPTATCRSCHPGDSTASPTIATGSHAKHLSEGGYGCAVCHHATVSDNVTISVYDNHVNGRPDVAFDPLEATGTYTGVGKTCNVSCHGIVAQVWGGTLVGGCLGCHSGAEQIYKPQTDYGTLKAPNPVDNAEYLYSGHGRSGVGNNYPGSNNLPAGFSNYTTAPVACYVCHSQAATHTRKSVNDPFRLGSATDGTQGGMGNFTGAWADNTDLLCLGCHGTSSQRSGHDNAAVNTIDALTHARGITGTKYTWPGPNYSWKCVDCHDPHGDGKSGAERYMMIRSGINAPTGSSDTSAGSDGQSITKRIDANVLAVAFNSLAGYSTTGGGIYSYTNQGNSAPWGPCEVCHTQTNAYSRTIDNAATHAGRTSRCTTCHPHSLGFAPTCFGCHGASGNRQYWPAGSPGSYPNRAGAHGNHVDAIGTWLYQENSALLLQNTANGSTSTKQIAICGWCHPNPGSPRQGTTELDHMDNTWTPGIADVHRDGRSGATASYLQYYDGNLAARGGVNDILGTFDNAAHTCSNVLCHNKVATPSTWNAPPTWATDNTCASTKCHPPPTTTSSSGVHYIHVAPKVIGTITNGMAYSCSECHVVPVSLRHGNGQVNLRFGGLEASVGGDNGFYDKDNSGGNVATAGDNNFRAYDNVYSRSCANIYCHGGDNPEWSGTGTRPAWDNSAYVGMFHCGPCHAVAGSPYTSGGASRVPLTPGNHGVHFKQYTSAAGVESVNRGPRIDPSIHTPFGCATCHNMGSDCINCHAMTGEAGAGQPTGTHADGKVDFRISAGSTAPAVPPSGVSLASTPACDYCHSTATVVTRTYSSPGTTGVAAAKANWDNGTFLLDCLTCHNGVVPGNSKAGGVAEGGIPAPNVYGDATGYGAESRGHNRPTSSGNYPGTGNPAGNRTCGECHNTASMHINGVADNTYSGERLLDNVNGVTGLTTVSGLCSACHTRAGASPATKKSVTTHGNTGFAKRLEGSTFALECSQCHEPHGMVNVSTGATGVNLWMINPTITVATGNTVSPVRLFAKSGANSFNAYDPGAGNELNASLYTTNAGDQICAVCHANSLAAGFPMTWNIGARHNAPGYGGNEAGKDCSSCHAHDQDGDIGTLDGLMPLACNDCHSYPGLDNTGVNLKQMGAGHRKHVGQPPPVGNGANNKGYDCTLCHFYYTHNQSGLVKGQAWPANYYDNVNIRFDNAWNPGSPTYAGVNAGTGTAPGIGGAGGACAGLYCHGGNASLNARWGGSATTPTWSGTVSCGACHDTGTLDTTSGTLISTGNHPVHIDITNYTYGPGMVSFSTGGGCTEGTGCHTRYDLAPIAQGGLHANNLKDLRSTSTDNGYVGATLSTTQVCRNCHTTYISANILVSGDNQVRTQANWNDNTFYVDCLTCHNGTAPGTQATSGIGGTGGRAGAIEGTWYTSKHGENGIWCTWCHGDVGHIGSVRPATNPWRMGNSLANYTVRGRIDYLCNYCHQIYGPPDHTWSVSGSVEYPGGTKGSTDTHPTVVLAVGTDKERWYQVPPSDHVPLFGNILDNSYNKAGGDNNYVLCVSCHDPHGVGTAPLDPGVRRFSGQNTDAKGNKMLRFNYSTGTPTELCAQCHK
jgi:predicted CxxxxCH...CXXCH cytochrome family protein